MGQSQSKWPQSQRKQEQGYPNPKRNGSRDFRDIPIPKEMGTGISGASESQRNRSRDFRNIPGAGISGTSESQRNRSRISGISQSQRNGSRDFRDIPVPEETGAGTPRGDPGSGISSGSHPRSIFHVTAPELQGGNAKGQLRAIESRFSQGISERRRWHQSNLKLAPNPRGKRERKNPKNPAGVEGSWRGSQSGEAQGYWWLL